MKKLPSDAGVSLLTALMFTLICLGMLLALMQLLLSGTNVSGSQRTYRNALEASYGGVELITKEFIPRLFVNYSTGIGPLLTAFGGTDPGKVDLMVNRESLGIKLSRGTDAWGSLSRTIDPKDTPDLQLQLKGDSGSNYKVYGKIVDTVPGNSDPTGIDYLYSGVGVAGAGAAIAPKHNPNVYSIEVRGERVTDPKEKALLSVLYAY